MGGPPGGGPLSRALQDEGIEFLLALPSPETDPLLGQPGAPPSARVPGSATCDPDHATAGTTRT